MEALHKKKVVPFFSRLNRAQNITRTMKSPKKLQSPRKFVGWKSLKREPNKVEKLKMKTSSSEIIDSKNIIHHSANDLLTPHPKGWKLGSKQISDFDKDRIIQTKLNNFHFYKYF